MKCDIKLAATNIGPHARLQGQWNTGNNRSVIYAPNGAGKTFLSRLFRLQESASRSEADCDSLLRAGSSSGAFSFSVKGANDPESRGLSVRLQRGTAPVVETTNGYVFHTFNSDYVYENLVVKGYEVDGNISGYIVGGANVDLTREQENLTILTTQGQEIRQRIDTAIAAMTTSLREAGVKPSMTEFKDVNFDSLLAMELPSEHDYDRRRDELQKLGTVDPSAFDTSTRALRLDVGFLEDARTLLSTVHTKSHFEKEFIEGISANLAFYSTGVELWTSNKERCPFCGTAPLGETALDLIKRYTEYLEDEESKVRSEARRLSGLCDAMLSTYRVWESAALRNSGELSKACGLMASLRERAVPRPPDSSRLESMIGSLKKVLKDKESDITASFGPRLTVDPIHDFLNEASKTSDDLGLLGADVSRALDNLDKQLREGRRELCKEALKKLRMECDSDLRERSGKLDECREAQRRLREKEATSRRERRPLVSDQMERLISLFFGDKYSFDRETFTLLLGKDAMPSTPNRVLSDGEKTVVAFCYYLASIPTVIESDGKWDDLFLVIDDPISSLDFNYVFMMAQCIRDLDGMLADQCGRIVRTRLLVLTHNVEFMNLLMRNRVGMKALTMADGTIVELKGDVLSPYDEHLRSIYLISIGREEPSYTTGNSIRHVVECAWRTHSPDVGKLEDFVKAQEEFNTAPFVYTLCQDLSHGAQRVYLPVQRDEYVRACKTVIDNVRALFPGQVKLLEKEMG